MNKDQLLHWKIPEFLHTKGDFKNMKTMLHDERRIMTQQVHQLKSEVAKSKSEAWDSQYELAGVKDRLENIENKRREAEEENAALDACHKAGEWYVWWTFTTGFLLICNQVVDFAKL